MNNTVLMTALSIAIGVGSAAETWAATQGDGKNRPSFEDLDANSDGLLSPAELDARVQARFSRADLDGNGVLSRAEIEARGSARAKERASKMIDRLDTDGDQAVSFEEMQAVRGGRMFERADANGDGAISKAEFDSMRAERKNRSNQAQ